MRIQYNSHPDSQTVGQNCGYFEKREVQPGDPSASCLYLAIFSNLRITYRTRTIKKDIVPLKDNYFHVLVASLEANNQRRDRRRGDYEMLHVPGVYTLFC